MDRWFNIYFTQFAQNTKTHQKEFYEFSSDYTIKCNALGFHTMFATDHCLCHIHDTFPRVFPFFHSLRNNSPRAHGDHLRLNTAKDFPLPFFLTLHCNFAFGPDAISSRRLRKWADQLRNGPVHVQPGPQSWYDAIPVEVFMCGAISSHIQL